MTEEPRLKTRVRNWLELTYFALDVTIGLHFESRGCLSRRTLDFDALLLECFFGTNG